MGVRRYLLLLGLSGHDRVTDVARLPGFADLVLISIFQRVEAVDILWVLDGLLHVFNNLGGHAEPTPDQNEETRTRPDILPVLPDGALAATAFKVNAHAEIAFLFIRNNY